MDTKQAEPAVPRSLESRGRHFLRAVAAAPWTSASVTGLLTGYYPSESGVVTIGDRPRLKGKTLAERLRNKGFRTVAVVSNPTLVQRGETLYAGFDTVDSDAAESRAGLVFKVRSATATTDAALTQIEHLRRGTSPWFLLVHYFEPHGPYFAPAKFIQAPKDHGPPLPKADTNFAPRGRIPLYQFNSALLGRNDYIARYRASARYALSEVERLLQAVDTSKDLEDTIVVFTADHGEMLGEQDYWFQHGITIDPSLVHIPLVIARGANDPVTREPRAVSNVDVLSTLCPLFGMGSCSETRGENLYDLSAERRFPIVVEQGAMAPGPDLRPHVAVSLRDGLLVGSSEGDLRNTRFASQGETQFTEREADLARKVIRHHLQYMRVVVRDPKTLDPEFLKKLRALGYLQGSSDDGSEPPPH